jgi:hypothetical protein
MTAHSKRFRVTVNIHTQTYIKKFLNSRSNTISHVLIVQVIARIAYSTNSGLSIEENVRFSEMFYDLVPRLSVPKLELSIYLRHLETIALDD